MCVLAGPRNHGVVWPLLNPTEVQVVSGGIWLAHYPLCCCQVGSASSVKIPKQFGGKHTPLNETKTFPLHNIACVFVKVTSSLNIDLLP